MVGRPIISEKGFYRAEIIRHGYFAHAIPARYALLLAFSIIPLPKINPFRRICFKNVSHKDSQRFPNPL
jgi:hypothetical protein